jgi:hypothetical protein
MRAYKYYLRDAADSVHLVGILPERRGNPQRIDWESIMNWGKMILGEKEDLSSLSFI